MLDVYSIMNDVLTFVAFRLYFDQSTGRIKKNHPISVCFNSTAFDWFTIPLFRMISFKLVASFLICKTNDTMSSVGSFSLLLTHLLL